MSILGESVSREEIWKHICNEEAKEIRNVKQGTGELYIFSGGKYFCLLYQFFLKAHTRFKGFHVNLIRPW